MEPGKATSQPPESIGETRGAEIAEDGEAEARRGGTFTGYVRALASRDAGLEDLAVDLLDALREALIRELRRRSLWTSPPGFVGIQGGPTWTAGPDSRTTPLDELVHDAYVFLFDRHLRRYLIQLDRHGAVDGLVVLDLRHYVSERQKAHDPLGFRVFEVLRAAVRGAVEAGELDVVHGDPRIRNDTCLALTPGRRTADAVLREKLPPVVARWVDELLPDLVLATGAARRQVERRLRVHLFDLEAEGVGVFRFKDLVDTLKDDVRVRWSGLYRDGTAPAADAAAVAGVFSAAKRLEDADSFRKLVDCVARRIEKHPGRERTRVYLDRLWRFLRHFALDDAERLPSYRRQAEALDVPRDRLPELYDKLAAMSRRCQKGFLGQVVDLDERRRERRGHG